MSVFQPVSQAIAERNAIVKTYPEHREIIIAERAIFRAPGYEQRAKGSPEAQQAKRESLKKALAEIDVGELSTYALARKEDEEHRRAADNLARAARRARTHVKDYAYCTPFRWFVTLTLNAERVDRYDVREITRKLNAWLDNRVRRDGLAYLLVPERHKDGAIHFHGLMTDAIEATDSGTVDVGNGKPRRPRSAAERARWLAAGGHTVYNLPAWTLGFSTAIELYGERERAVGYVCKYVGKQMEGGKIGGRWYYSGGDLRSPAVEYVDLPIDYGSEKDAYTFEIEGLGVRCRIIRERRGEGC